MELRTLQYFLAVAREQSISAAADYLHMTQPPLSRQMKELEDELGKALFVRGNRKITLTEEGMILKKRAEEILSLSEKTKKEILSSDNNISGTIYISAAEVDGFDVIAKAMKETHDKYPNIVFNMLSGNAEGVAESLESGLADFGLFVGETNRLTNYSYIKLLNSERWGILTRCDNLIAEKGFCTKEDLKSIPLAISIQGEIDNAFNGWLGEDISNLNIVARYNLNYNTTFLVSQNVCSSLSLEKQYINTENSNLKFVPLDPPLYESSYFVWRKYQVFSKASAKFLEVLEKMINE